MNGLLTYILMIVIVSLALFMRGAFFGRSTSTILVDIITFDVIITVYFIISVFVPGLGDYILDDKHLFIALAVTLLLYIVFSKIVKDTFFEEDHIDRL